MADHQAILEEEFEVLESIFPDELERTASTYALTPGVSDTEVRIRVEPEEEHTAHPLVLALTVTYPPTYPDVIPQLGLEDTENGELREGEEEELVAELEAVAEESLGMAMTFTIATAAREALTALIEKRIQKERAEDEAKTLAYEEEEKKKTRGTPLTRERYNAWRDAFRAELAAKKQKEEEDRVKALPPREREDVRRRMARPSGRQLFETSKVSASADDEYDDGETVDLAKYSREERDAARWGEEEKGIKLEDSDDE